MIVFEVSNLGFCSEVSHSNRHGKGTILDYEATYNLLEVSAHLKKQWATGLDMSWWQRENLDVTRTNHCVSWTGIILDHLAVR